MNDDGRRARRKENCSLCFRVSKGEQLPGQLRSCDVLPTIELQSINTWPSGQPWLWLSNSPGLEVYQLMGRLLSIQIVGLRSFFLHSA